MSTLIETNTAGLQEILNEVYNLPNRSTGGSSEPDLVIGLNVVNTKVLTDDGNAGQSLYHMNLDDISLVSGSISAVVEKIRLGLPVRVQLNEIHSYWTGVWMRCVAYATHVGIYNNTEYPEENCHKLSVSFFLNKLPEWADAPVYVAISFDVSSGAATRYTHRYISNT